MWSDENGAIIVVMTPKIDDVKDETFDGLIDLLRYCVWSPHYGLLYQEMLDMLPNLGI